MICPFIQIHNVAKFATSRWFTELYQQYTYDSVYRFWV